MSMPSLSRMLVAALLLQSMNAIAGIETGQPAVRGLEVNFQPQSGEIDGAAWQAVEGAVIFPLSHRWGGQLDYISGDADDPDRDFDVVGFTGHIFWRDPKVGTLDFSVSNVATGIIDYGRFDVLLEYYWDKRTVTLASGYQFGDIPHSVTGIFEFREYLPNNLSLHINAAAADSQVVYGGGFDFRTPLNGLHLFGESLAGNGGFDSYRFGIRLFLGESSSQNEQRDRQLSLANRQTLLFFTNASEVRRAQRAALEQPPLSFDQDQVSPP